MTYLFIVICILTMTNKQKKWVRVTERYHLSFSPHFQSQGISTEGKRVLGRELTFITGILHIWPPWTHNFVRHVLFSFHRWRNGYLFFSFLKQIWLKITIFVKYSLLFSYFSNGNDTQPILLLPPLHPFSPYSTTGWAGNKTMILI